MITVRSFDGSDDTIQTSIGSCNINGAVTMLAIVYLDDLGQSNTFFRVQNAGGTKGWSLISLQTSGLIRFANITVDNRDSTTALIAGTWYLIAATKATGTVTSRFHIYDYSAETWVHEDTTGGTTSNIVSPDMDRINFGSNGGGLNLHDGKMAACALWNAALSDGDLESLVPGDYADITGFSTAPVGAWRFDQASPGDGLEDDIGSADETSITGTASVLEAPFGFDSDSPITFVGRGAKGAGGNTAADITMGVPHGLKENDIVLFPAGSGGGGEYNSIEDNNAVAATQIDEVSDGNITGSFWWYRCPSTVPTSFEANRNTGGQPLGIPYAFRGCLQSSTPFEDATIDSEITTAETTPDTATITTTDVNRWVVGLFVIDDDPDWTDFPESSFADLGGDGDTTGSDMRIDACAKIQATAATVNGVAIGTLPGTEFWVSMTLALIPEPTSAGPTDVLPTPVAIPAAVPSPAISRSLALGGVPVTIPAAVPSPTVQITLELLPAALAIPAVVPAPAMSFGAISLSPVPVVSTVAPAAPTITTGPITASPTPAVAQTSVPSPALALSNQLAVPPVVIPAVVPAPSLARSLAASPAPVEIPTSVPQPSVSTALAVSPDPAVATVSVPAPNVTVTGTNVTAQPDPVQIPSAVPAPTISGQLSITATPAVASVAPVAPTVSRSLAVNPDPTLLAASVPAPEAARSLLVAPEAVPVPISVPAPTVTVQGGPLAIAPDPVEIPSAVPSPSVSFGELTAGPVPVELTITVPAPSATLALTAEPDPVGAQLDVPAPSVELRLEVAAEPAVVVVEIPPPAVVLTGATISVSPAPVVLVLLVPAAHIGAATVAYTQTLTRGRLGRQTLRHVRVGSDEDSRVPVGTMTTRETP
jgi:hypothetical protein